MWLLDHPRVRVVPHEAIFPDITALPTFSSHAIEACLWRIEGLSEHFVYFNDDMFLGRATSKATFFTRDGASVAHLEPESLVTGGKARAVESGELRVDRTSARAASLSLVFMVAFLLVRLLLQEDLFQGFKPLFQRSILLLQLGDLGFFLL